MRMRWIGINVVAAVFGAAVSLVGADEPRAREEKVSLDQVPAAVKAVIQAEGGRLEDVEKQTQDGKTVY
ncbi:MAG: hypothetical protein HRF43_18760, partial [Phycisphaerae bacterium]